MTTVTLDATSQTGVTSIVSLTTNLEAGMHETRVFRRINSIHKIMMVSSVFGGIVENGCCQRAFDIVILAYHLA